MSGVDLDFARYVAYRRGVLHQRARDGAAYAYTGERRLRRALNTARPVTMAIEATTRMWRKAAKNNLLGTSVKVTDQQLPRAHDAVRAACKTLHLDLPPVYAAPTSSKITAQTLGTNDDAYIVINSSLLERLSDEELVAIFGSELGHIQNNHVVYSTALFYLTHEAMMFVRWIVQPALVPLQAWARRAEVTCDRAALVCTRNLDVALSALVKTSLGSDQAVNIEEYLKQLPETKTGIGKFAELFRSLPYLPKRIQALQLFAESSFYRRFTGGDTEGALSTDDLDAKVAEILKVF